jgi:hypothetical protein
MGRPGITDPECYSWLHEGIINGLKEKCESQSLRYPMSKMEDLVKKKLDGRISEGTGIWLEGNHDEYIEDFDNDEEALLEHAQLATIGNLYENCLDDLVIEILQDLSKES